MKSVEKEVTGVMVVSLIMEIVFAGCPLHLQKWNNVKSKIK
jgi:hypothetical protein